MGQLDKIFELVDAYKKMSVEYSRMAWVQYTAGYDFGLSDKYQEIMAFLQSKDNFQIVKDHMSLDLNEVDKRRMTIVYKQFESYHKSDEINALMMEIQNKTTELSKILNTFRYKIDGQEKTSVELSQILTGSEDRELRKKAYLAKNQINKPLVEAGFIDLLNMRKDLAKLNGFDNFVDMRLDEDELDPSIFSTWKDELNALLPKMNETRKAYANKYLKDDSIYPWDEAYVQNKIAPSLSKKVNMAEFYKPIASLFNDFGFDLDDYNITYDVFSRKNKSEWGYNFPIETAKDSRILANVKDKFYEYGVLLHETGHGVHSFLQSADEPILNMGISGIVTEGIANLFGALKFDETFYKQFFTDDFEVAKEEFEAIKKYNKLNALRSVTKIIFDQELYRNDIESLDDIYDLYWKMSSDFLGGERGDYEPPCLFVIHHTTHPIYYHNYLMGDVTCEMLAEVFNDKHSISRITEKSADFGKFLYEEVIQPSGKYTYSELFRRISGKDFSLNYMK